MNNIWNCPHVVLIPVDETEELNAERQRLINVLSNHIDQVATEPEPEPKHRTHATKNESFQKLARNSKRTPKQQVVLTDAHIIQLSGDLAITVCDACYLAMREDIVVEILKGIRDGR